MVEASIFGVHNELSTESGYDAGSLEACRPSNPEGLLRAERALPRSKMVVEDRQGLNGT